MNQNSLCNKSLALSITAIFLLCLVFSHPANAQNNPPPGQDAGAQATRFKIETEQEKKRLEKEKLKAPEIEMPKEEEKKAAAEAVFFTLKEVKITGVSLFKPEDFRSIYQPYLNQKVSFTELELIAEKIKAKYKEKGYLTTNVYFPEQDIRGGIVEIRIMEGKMGKLKIEGSKWFSSELIKKYFHTKENELLNVKNLVRDILRLYQNPDLEVKTLLAAGEKPETSDVTLKITDHFPWHIGTAYDNRGTRLLGRSRPSLSLRSTNATGNLDTLYFTTQFGSRSLGESLSYRLPLDSYGTKLSLDFSHFNLKLGKEFKPFDITGNSYQLTPQITRELYLSEYSQASLNVGMDIKSIKKKMLGVTTANDQLRTPYFGFDLTRNDAYGQTAFSPRFNFGTKNFWGSSGRNHPTSSRAGTGGAFFRYEHDASRIQKMPFGSYAILRSQFQLATHSLPSSEQFQLGGGDSVRGYPEGDYLADTGGNMNFDWIFPMYLIPASWKLPNSDTALRNQIEPLIFVDAGGGKLKKVLPGERRDKLLVGAGGGVRFRLYNTVFLSLQWARRVGDRVVAGSGPSTFYITFQCEK